MDSLLGNIQYLVSRDMKLPIRSMNEPYSPRGDGNTIFSTGTSTSTIL